MIVLDGPLGTALEAGGLRLEAPLWSAGAMDVASDRVRAVHAGYAAAGATVHTAGTFRAGPHHAGADHLRLTRRAVDLCRGAVPRTHRVFGSLGPLADCYRPWETPAEVRGPHRIHARALREAGVDGLLVETFADPREAVVATEEAARTGLEVWTSLTAGPDADLLDPPAFARLAGDVRAAGASVVLLNCTAIDRCAPYVDRLASIGLPWGCSPNAGVQGGPFGWGAPGSAARAAQIAASWRSAGATVIGGCCGMDAAFIRAVRQASDAAT